MYLVLNYYASDSSKSRGEAIFFETTLESKIHDEGTINLFSNFSILDIPIQDYHETLATKNGPNNDESVFFENIKTTYPTMAICQL